MRAGFTPVNQEATSMSGLQNKKGRGLLRLPMALFSLRYTRLVDRLPPGVAITVVTGVRFALSVAAEHINFPR
jgi:hypothetical protein